MKFRVVICGGTFDHFHKGHRKFLQFALSKGEKLIIGVTSEKFIRNKLHNGRIESYSVRKKSLEDFLKNQNVYDRVNIGPIDDIFGHTLLKNVEMDAIAVSEGTLKGAELINNERKERKLPPLEVLVSPMIFAQDKKPISSERIRNGEINRNGRLFVKPLWFSHKLLLTQKLRNKLKKPLGSLSLSLQNKDIDISFFSAVGDVSAKYFNENFTSPQISIIDFCVKRKKEFSDIKELGFLGTEKIFKIKNPPGFITPSIFKTLSWVFSSFSKKKVIIQVDGEEDLCVLPLILYSPLGFTIFYGQPDEGIVRIDVDEKIKEKTYNIVSSFEVE